MKKRTTASSLGRLLDVKGAAIYLDLTVAQMRRHIKARRVRVLKPGRKVQIYERWCDEFRASFTVEPTGQTRGFIPDDDVTYAAPIKLRDLLPRQRLIRVGPGRARRVSQQHAIG